MSWSNLKTIIIYILLLLNLFLLALVGMNSLRAQRYQDEALKEAAAVLERSNIRVRWEELPREMRLSPMVAARDLQKEEELAHVFLGEDAKVSASGGGLYVYEGQTVAGTASFRSNGEFTVTYEVPQNQSASPQEMMRRLDVDTGQARETERSASAEQEVNGVPVYGASPSSQGAAGMSFAYDGQGQLCSVSGRLFLGRITAEQGEETPLSVPTALIRFFNFVVDSGDVCREIVSMVPVYRAVGDPARLSPAWLIRTDTGGYFVDAATAEVSRAPAE